MNATSSPRFLPERLPEPGELVRVRSRHWLVEEVAPAPAPEQSARVRLACADDDAQGRTIEVFWDCEIDRCILEREGWADLAARGFDPPRQFAAFLHTLRWNSVTATDPNLFQSPFRAGIRIDAYQMEPLRKALRLPRVNLFIADDTGLGKTIEAGLIARELLRRKKAKTIVVAAPPSVLEQWKAEMEELPREQVRYLADADICDSAGGAHSWSCGNRVGRSCRPGGDLAAFRRRHLRGQERL